MGSDQALFYQMFLTEQLESDQYKDNREFLSIITPYANNPCRVAFSKGNENHDHPHFFVMTVPIEEILLNHDGQNVLLALQPPHLEMDSDGEGRFGDI